MMTMTAQPKVARRLELGKDVLLARFVKHNPDGRHRIKVKTQVTVKGQTVDGEHVSSPYSILLPRSIRDTLSLGMRPVDRLIDGLQPYPIVGLKGMTETTLEQFVPRWEQALATLDETRQEVRDRWSEEVDAFNRTVWTEILEDDYEAEVGQRLKRLYRELGTRYSVDYDLWKPPEPVDVAFGSPVVQKWLKEGRANAEQAVEAALLEFITGPRDALVKAAEEVIATLIDPDTKVIKVGTFTAMKAAMQKLRALREISDVDLIHQIDAMEDRLDDVIGTAESAAGGFTLAIKAKADELVGGINQVIEAARDQDALEDTLTAFGKSGRAIELD
jgi:hypothetical protein